MIGVSLSPPVESLIVPVFQSESLSSLSVIMVLLSCVSVKKFGPIAMSFLTFNSSFSMGLSLCSLREGWFKILSVDKKAQPFPLSQDRESIFFKVPSSFFVSP